MKILKTKVVKTVNISQRVLFMYRVPLRVASATAGTIPSDSEINKIGLPTLDEKVQLIVDKLEDFTDFLEEVPDKLKDPNGNRSIIDKNDEKIYQYSKVQFMKVYNLKESDIADLYDANGASGGDFPIYTQWFVNNAKVFARGKFSGFFDAVQFKVQQKRELDQQIKGLRIVQQDFKQIKIELARSSFVLSTFSQKTNTKEYILNTSKSQKLKDLKELNDKLKEIRSPLTRIVSLSYSDLPLIKYSNVVKAFEFNPKDVDNIKAVKEALVSFKNELIDQYYKEGSKVFDLDAILGKLS